MKERALSRRDFVRAAMAGATLVGPLSMLGCGGGTQAGTDAAGGASAAQGWDMVPEILARIKPPTFPSRDFVITEYGAVEGGETLNTEAVANAIAACNAAGGGRVVVPAGRFLTGAVHLLSNVNLYVSEGATLAFSRDPADFLPRVLTRFEGTEMMSYSPFIYALDQENIGVTGPGTIDGQADETTWWSWPRRQGDARQRLHQVAEDGVPVEQRIFGEGSFLRPNFVQPYRCRNVVIEGLNIVNSPMWELNPVLCQNVTIRNVQIHSHGPNNDGCDPESSRDVLIEGCTFDTGDDCIAIKSGRNADGRRINVPCENIIVRGCQMQDGHGGVTIGSEISGGVRYVFAEDNHMDSPNLDRALRFKNNAMRGGLLEHIYMRNVQVGQVAEGVISVNFTYEEGANGPYTPVVRDVHVENVTSGKSRYALYLRGLPDAPISDIHIVDCTFDNVAEGSVIEYVEGLDLQNFKVNGSVVTAEELLNA